MTNNDQIRKTNGRGRLYQSVLDTVGDTPVIRINHLAPSHVELYVKAEFFNPAGSVKDRLALNIIEEHSKRFIARVAGPTPRNVSLTSGSN